MYTSTALRSATGLLADSPSSMATLTRYGPATLEVTATNIRKAEKSICHL
jgi:hypothetical protein